MDNTTQIKCPANKPKIINTDDSSAQQCPEYFRWIHEDLIPWKRTGITKETIESRISKANLRILVIDGKLYLEKYTGVFQTRDVFTIWGILQLLKLYPGKVPDVDFLFHYGDTPVVPRRDYMGANASVPPPLFHYCGDDSTFDLVFPDWSFWGWPEINVKPWVSLRDELRKGNKKTQWRKRIPYAYWKGNSRVNYNRKDLMGCNVTDQEHDWNARLYKVNWDDESKKGFRRTNLADQCTHRYKIYIEGMAWSVSEKYILACDSMTLLVKPKYYDFFTRGLQPLVHYWPIDNRNKCRSVKFGVEWGNSHKKKLMKYKPTVPPEAIEVCSETVVCSEQKEVNKRFKIESMVKSPSASSPCVLAAPYSRDDIQAIKNEQESVRRRVQEWERSGNARSIEF
ncbi:hypothetical protein DCAR_0104614 [Daucus carota subsp. sativus]|uniref:Uncharacterized protein n=1 Tax=Daucus carota subsp. sativus TaxID=79200 RepID=A0A166IYR9_DAUCS|nr:hypothetical protein DCAR_0104614 [Daucus carota subsp. sativus]